jgi:hypothetical protein
MAPPKVDGSAGAERPAIAAESLEIKITSDGYRAYNSEGTDVTDNLGEDLQNALPGMYKAELERQQLDLESTRLDVEDKRQGIDDREAKNWLNLGKEVIVGVRDLYKWDIMTRAEDRKSETVRREWNAKDAVIEAKKSAKESDDEFRTHAFDEGVKATSKARRDTQAHQERLTALKYAHQRSAQEAQQRQQLRLALKTVRPQRNYGTLA